MYVQHGKLMYSPTDLTLFMDSPFASWMEHFASSSNMDETINYRG